MELRDKLIAFIVENETEHIYDNIGAEEFIQTLILKGPRAVKAPFTNRKFNPPLEDMSEDELIDHYNKMTDGEDWGEFFSDGSNCPSELELGIGEFDDEIY